MIKERVDLRGRTITFPRKCTLVFKKGGLLSNGTIVGEDTRIRYEESCFENVNIKGTWHVPEIRSEMFLTHSHTSLTNLFNLQSRAIKNTIIISPGVYHVSSNAQSAALPLTSNTNLQLDGDIILDKQTNNKFYNGYYVISVSRAKNVRINGIGSISGDLGRSGITSEYGHGICLFQSSNVTVEGIRIKDVQGDGVAISIGSSNIFVEGITIEHYYRNGISVVDGNNIRINNVTVRNGGETSPYAAIDIEPNEGYNIDNVKVNNLDIKNCTVGISGYVPKNAVATNVIYDGVRMVGVKKSCITSSLFDNLSLSNVLIEQVSDDAEIMRLLENKSLYLSNIRVKAGNCKAKYPFYLNNKRMEVDNCSFECPQLFSWHLGNAQFSNSDFVFDSFIWTAADVANRNIKFDKCSFNGPLFMRPDNVLFKECKFKNNRTKHNYLVKLEDSRKTGDGYSGVTLEDNTFETGGKISESTALQCKTKRSVITKSNYKRNDIR